jgi:hypothetical protein
MGGQQFFHLVAATSSADWFVLLVRDKNFNDLATIKALIIK